jgi:hypothetical protein
LPNYTPVIPLSRSRTWVYLQAGVPITLLCDLLDEEGPPSREIYAAEALEDDVRRSHPPGSSTAGQEPTTSTG